MPAMKPGSDRRIRKTRAALSAAVIELIGEKGYDAVTVQDIIDRADVARSTFYGHYKDKDDLLLDGLQLIRPMLESESPSTIFGFSLPLFIHARAFRRIYQAVAGHRAGRIMEKSIRNLVADFARHDLTSLPRRRSEVPDEVLIKFVVITFMGVLEIWLTATHPAPATEVDRWFHTLVRSGMSSISIDAHGR